MDDVGAPAARGFWGQLARFSVGGVIGFVVDTAVLYAGLALGLGFYVGRLVSYLFAASATWAFNRYVTFPEAPRERPIRQWAKFLSTNAVGGVANYAAYAAAIGWGPAVFAAHPVLAVALGSLAGLVFNFAAARLVVFK